MDIATGRRTHVRPFVPWRRILPAATSPFRRSAGQSRTVASSAIAAGAALVAWSIFHSSEWADDVRTPPKEEVPSAPRRRPQRRSSARAKHMLQVRRKKTFRAVRAILRT